VQVNCAIEEREAKDVYDSMCGFDWDKSPKKIMQLNLFAHALVRAASLYLENIMYVPCSVLTNICFVTTLNQCAAHGNATGHKPPTRDLQSLMGSK